MKTPPNQLLSLQLLLLLLPLLLQCPSADACRSNAPAGGSPAPTAAAGASPPATRHASIECNPYHRPRINCSGEATCKGYKCICTEGGHVYVPGGAGGGGCRDVDECRELLVPCSGSKVTCVNAKGGYECVCDEEGHRYHPFKGCGQHSSCHFPFKYKGTFYHHCIRSGHHRLWCSKTADYDKDKTFVNCASEFLTMHCHFPFKYNGVEHKACVGEGSEKWCATTYNYDVDRRWDVCY